MHRRACLSLILLAALTSPAWAHHSLAGYDQSKPMALEGVVSEFSFIHPHPYLTILVGAPGGLAQPWKLEMDNLFELHDVGMTKDTLRPGDRVLVRGDPNRTRPRELYLRRLDRPQDGFRYEQVGSSPRVSYGAR